MHEPVSPHEPPEILGDAPEDRTRPREGIGWGLLASVLGHGGLVLVVTIGRCDTGWITGAMFEEEAPPERAFVVFPVDEDAFARLARDPSARPPDPAVVDPSLADPPVDAALAVVPPAPVDPDRLRPVPARPLPPLVDPVVIDPPELTADLEPPEDLRVDPDAPEPEVVVLDEAEREKAAREKAEQDRDERERAERDSAEREKAERLAVHHPDPDDPPDRDDPPDPVEPDPDDPDRAEPDREDARDLDDPPDPEALAEAERRDVPVPDEPEPEPEPPLPDPLDPVAWRRFLDLDDLREPVEPIEDPDYIGSHDALPDRETTRAPVTADLAGPTRTVAPTTLVLPTAARPEIRAGDPLADADVRTQVDAGESSGGTPAEGGPRGPGEGSGATGAGGDGWDGGPAADRSVAAEPSEAIPATEGVEARPDATSVTSVPPTDPGDAVLEDPDGTDRIGSSEPAVTASIAVAAQEASDASPASRADPSDGDGVALAERTGDGADRGGSGIDGNDRPAAPSVSAGGGSGTGEGDRLKHDPVTELRDALGWGAVDREALPASPGQIASPGSEGTMASSPQGVVLEDVEIGFLSWARVTDDPVGRYSEAVFDIVRAAWHERDLDEDSKALGVQGRVTIVFHVFRNGDVSTPAIERSSGHDVLDRLALSAIPDKLPRFPRDLEGTSIAQRITFNYRNPMIATEPSP